MILLQSTFTALLRLTLDDDFHLQEVKEIDRGRGVYFGLSRLGEQVFYVARNTDVEGRVMDTEHPVSTLRAWPAGRTWAIPETRGIHQIRARDGLIWLMNCRDPELVAFDPASGTVRGVLSLAPLVPEELRHPFPPEHPLDRYHFNSLEFAEDRLFLLAHNWGYGSFALELEYRGVGELLGNPRLQRTHRDLGQQSHDIHVEQEIVHVLDSANGRLLISENGRSSRGTPAGELGFARGLGVTARHFWIGHGSVARREDRINGPTSVSIFDRSSLRLVRTLEIGRYGNPCDLLILSEPDLSDSCP